jgi:hypothetical protein
MRKFLSTAALGGIFLALLPAMVMLTPVGAKNHGD